MAQKRLDFRVMMCTFVTRNPSFLNHYQKDNLAQNGENSKDCFRLLSHNRNIRYRIEVKMGNGFLFTTNHWSIKKNPCNPDSRDYRDYVAGAGLEPTTFGL